MTFRFTVFARAAALSACLAGVDSGDGAGEAQGSPAEASAAALSSVDCPWGTGQCAWPGTFDGSKALRVGGIKTGTGSAAKVQRTDLLAQFTMQGSAFLSEVKFNARREGLQDGVLWVELRADAPRPDTGTLLARGRTLLRNASDGSYELLPVTVRTVAPVTRLVDGAKYWLRVWVQPSPAAVPASVLLDAASVASAGQALKTCSASGSAWPAACSSVAPSPGRLLAFLPVFETIASASCEDRLRNGDEPGRDCGTACAKACSLGSVCFEDRDCGAAAICRAGTPGPGNTDAACARDLGTARSTCSCLPKLEVGAACGSSGDCVTGLCQGSTGERVVAPRCVPATCGNGRRDGNETDVDCGGSCGNLCAGGKTCAANADCDQGLLCGGDTKPYTCRPARVNGASCLKDWECGSGACLAKVCRSPGQTGEPCDSRPDCLGVACTAGKCALPSYTDRVLNGSETDVDCGGTGTGFRACAGGQSCSLDTDCRSGFSCEGGVCGAATGNACSKAADCFSRLCGRASPTTKPVCLERFASDDPRHCSNGFADADETDLDCGGGVCRACKDKLRCLGPRDCTSGVCTTSGQCAAPTCLDGVRNGLEKGVDCGGGSCRPCASGVAVDEAAACASKVRSEELGVCVDGTCFDAVKNGGETDVDCGGASCARCSVASACLLPGDCVSGACGGTPKKCLAPSSSDRVRNGDETDVDCGGSSGKACALAKSCLVRADCAAGAVCANGRCAAASCADGVFDRTKGEVDIDCGGTCGPCAVGKACTTASQCTTGVCAAAAGTAAKRCVAPGGTDGVQNGDETGPDCGGSSAPGCAYAQGCQADRDCAAGMVCELGRCGYGACGNSTQATGRSSCGRLCATRCPEDASCRGDVDCAGGAACVTGADGRLHCSGLPCLLDGNAYKPGQVSPADPCLVCAAGGVWAPKAARAACDDGDPSTHTDRCIASGASTTCQGIRFDCTVGVDEKCVSSKAVLADGQACQVDDDCVVAGTDVPKRCVGGRCEGPACRMTLKAARTPCGAVSGVCAAGGVCDGASAACPPVVPRPGFICREASSACDETERCAAGSFDCPADAAKAVGGACDGGHCDARLECLSCAPGEKWDATSRACVRCPSGQVSLGRDATACVPGVNCPVNKVWTGTGTGCVACPAGTTSAGGAVSACTAVCPTGYFQPADGAACTAWRTCPAGQGFSPGTATTDATCAACPSGTASPGDTAACSPCAAGTAAGAGASACAACPEGAWSAQGASSCRSCASPCGLGTYESKSCTPTQNRVCTPISCNAGTFWNGSTCAACPSGFSSVGGYVTSCAVDVNECASGNGGCGGGSAEKASCTNLVGGFRCACNAGYTGDGTSCTPVACAPGQYWNGFACTACASGYTTAGGFATGCVDVDECLTGNGGCGGGDPAKAACTNASGGFACGCAPGSFGDGRTCTAWTSCAPGTFVSSTPSPTTDRACTACAPGTFTTAANGSVCAAWTTCPAGTAYAAGSTSSDRTCSPCPAGTYSPGGTASCVAHSTCGPGSYVSREPSAGADRGCTFCAAGYSSAVSNAAACVDVSPPVNPDVTPVPARTAVTLTWTGGADAGSGLDHFLVSWSKGANLPSPGCADGISLPASTFSQTFRSLDQTTTYAFRVCGVDKAGNISNGSAGTTATQTCTAIANCADGKLTCDTDTDQTCSGCGAGYTLSGDLKSCSDRTAPANPTGLAATPGYVALTLTWNAVSDAGGAGLAGYRVAWRAGAAAPAACSTADTLTASTHIVLPSLSNASAYAWRVCAVDKAGNISSGESGSGATLTCNAVPNCAGAVTCTSASDAVCASCAAGYAFNAAGTCSPCSAGTYASEGATACSLCPFGTFSGAAAASCTAWRTCGAGTGYAAGTVTQDATCSLCPAGTASAGGSATCAACASGSFSAAGASRCSPWQTCAAGSGYTAGTATVDATCSACPGSTYATGGTMACTAWQTCAAGSGYAAGTASSNSTCSTCPAGKYSTGGTMACTAWRTCDAGYGYTAGSSTADATCLFCAKGTASAGGTGTCDVCGNGTYSGTSGASSCTPGQTCAAGFGYAAGSASSNATCTACTLNATWSAGGTNACAALSTCATGTYVSTTPTLSSDRICIPCAAGYTTTSTNALTCVDAAPPASPDDVTAVPAQDSVTLLWSDVEDPVGSGLAGYVIAFKQGTSIPPTGCAAGTGVTLTTVTPGSSSAALTGSTSFDNGYVFTGLAATTSYAYRVCAVDQAGNTSAGNTQGSWGSTATQTCTGIPHCASGLSCTTATDQTCGACDAGWTLSTDATSCTDVTAPANPTGVAASASYVTATVSWTAVTDAAGSGLKGYRVAYAPGAAAPPSCASTDPFSVGSSMVLTGLGNASTYAFRVCAVTVQGL